METKCIKKFLERQVVTIGLGQGFVDPLEANGLYLGGL